MLHASVLILDPLLEEDQRRRHFTPYVASGYAWWLTLAVIALCAWHIIEASARWCRKHTTSSNVLHSRKTAEFGCSSVNVAGDHPVLISPQTAELSSISGSVDAATSAADVALSSQLSFAHRGGSVWTWRSSSVQRVIGVFLTYRRRMTVGLRAALLVYLLALCCFVVCVFGIDNLEELDRDHDPAVNLVLPTLLLCSLFLMFWCLLYLAYCNVFAAAALFMANIKHGD